MRKIWNYLKRESLLITSMCLASILRLANLGYSDYQGDEIKALYIVPENTSVIDFLLEQRKGPMQFLVTYLLKFINPNYDNEFLIRLPFAIASILSVFFFYKLIRNLFSEKIAFFSTFFFITNGFLIAFARIVQYQSFVILFMVMALYFLSLAVTNLKYQKSGIYLGLISWALSILAHYDGVFIAPFAFYLLFRWFRESGTFNKSKIKHFLIAGFVSAAMLSIFYVPFVVNIASSTVDYWSGRLDGSVSSKISSSNYLFTVYQPIYVIHIYAVLFLFGLLGFFIVLIKKYIPDYKFIYILKEGFSRRFREFFSPTIGILAWFGFSFLFMEGIVYIPGTHIYTYLIPMFVIMGLGVYLISTFFNFIYYKGFARTITGVGIGIVFTFIYLQSYTIYVDHKEEYPWQNEKFLIFTLHKPTAVYHLSMFGFPYNRGWESIADLTRMFPDIDAYSTNERKTISRYYVPLVKSSDMAGFYIYIKYPQSFTDEMGSEKARCWAETHTPEFTLSKGGEEIVLVYIMQPGTAVDVCPIITTN